MRLQKFWILLPNRFTWSNEPWNTAHKTTSLPQTKWLLVSTFLYQLSSALLHWWRRTNFKQEGIIVGTVSTNICPLRGTYFYVNRRTKSKRKNIFVGMVAHFKNTSQWDRSVRTFLLTGWWNYCTQSYQFSHYISKYISKSSIHFEYKLDKLCGLLVLSIPAWPNRKSGLNRCYSNAFKSRFPKQPSYRQNSYHCSL